MLICNKPFILLYCKINTVRLVCWLVGGRRTGDISSSVNNMIVRVEHDAYSRDSFLRTNINFNSNSVQLTNTDNGEIYYVWVDCNKYTQSNCINKEIVPPGNYLVTPLDIEQCSKVTVRTESLCDYERVARNAGRLLERDFLKQVRVVGKRVLLWIEGKPVWLVGCVEEVSLVGKDSLIEILPPPLIDDGVAIHTNIDRIRVRRSTFSKLFMNWPSNVRIRFMGGEYRVYGRDDALKGWMYLPETLMKDLKLIQHQFITFEIINQLIDDATEQKELFVKSSPLYIEPDICESFKKLLTSTTTDSIIRGLVVEGESQVGKSFMLKGLEEEGDGPFIYRDLMTISSKDFTGKKKDILKVFMEVIPLAPCVLILDHIDRMFPIASNEQGEEDKFYTEQLALSFMQMVRDFMSTYKSPVVIVGESLLSMHKIISESPLWMNTLIVNRPGSEMRKALLSDKNLVDKELVEETAGWLPYEVLEYSKSSFKVKHCHGVLEWDDIKGLDTIKERMEEALFWPILHSDLYKKNGYKQAGGVLLCGPSGTGKTLLSRSFSLMMETKYKVKVIHISGPSLLQKYVGSSEAALRGIFSKARAQRPALIVIDELEALLPQRGRQDSSGTSDRMVNQMLTELDGAEDRDDVYILGTTSRPELVDVAVLRPGRIDLRIDFKSVEDPYAVVKGMAMPELDSIVVAQLADLMVKNGKSAADIRSILYDAQLLANRNSFNSDQRSFVQAEHIYSIISNERELDTMRVQSSTKKSEQRKLIQH